MLTKEYMYKGKVVEFFFSQDLMVNATEMGVIFNKRPVDFLRVQSTKNWIEWLEKNEIIQNRSEYYSLRPLKNDLLEGEIRHRSADLVPLLITKGGGKEGGATWMHHLLAIDFAMWLDIDFKGWVILKINQLLYQYGSQKRTLALEKLQLQERLNRIENEKSNNPEIQEVFKILKQQKQLKGEEFNLNIQFNKNLFGE